MSKLDISNDPDLLSFSNSIELLESRKRQLLERRNLCKTPLDLKKIDKGLKEIDVQMKKTRSREAKVLRMKVG